MGDPTALDKQAYAILHELDELYDFLMDRAEQASADGSHRVADSRAMKAHGVLSALRVVQRIAGIEPYVWENVHRRKRAE